MLVSMKQITIDINIPRSFTCVWFRPTHGAKFMYKIIISITVFLVFLWVALSSSIASQENDNLSPEIDVEIGNEFAKISDLVVHSLEAKNNGKSVVGSNWMIVTANPYATDVGAKTLCQS